MEIFPLDMNRAMHRQNDRATKPKSGSLDRPLADLSILMNDKRVGVSFGHHTERWLRDVGYTITGLRVNTVFFESYFKRDERTVQSSIVRGSQGIINGGLLTSAEVVAEYDLRTEKRTEKEERRANEGDEGDLGNGGTRTQGGRDVDQGITPS